MTHAIKKFMKNAPVLLKMQASVLACALTVAVVVGTVYAPKGMQKIPFALPANEQMPLWENRIDQFALKLSEGFRIRVSTAREFSGWILEAAERQNLDPELLASVVLTESSFRKDVRSHVGAIGPAQIRPQFWSGFCGSSNLTDPAENIYCGAQILAYYQDNCGGLSCALHAYNIGPNRKDDQYRQRAGRRYVAKVERNHGLLRNTAL